MVHTVVGSKLAEQMLFENTEIVLGNCFNSLLLHVGWHRAQFKSHELLEKI